MHADRQDAMLAVMSGPVGAPMASEAMKLRTMTSASRRRSTRWRPIRWSGCAARTSSIPARVLLGQMACASRVAAAQYLGFPRRARAHRDRRLRACARATGQALCRSGVEGEPGLPGARAVYLACGRARSTASSTRPRWTSAMPSARASSFRSSSTRCRRPTRSPATRRR